MMSGGQSAQPLLIQLLPLSSAGSWDIPVH